MFVKVLERWNLHRKPSILMYGMMALKQQMLNHYGSHLLPLQQSQPSQAVKKKHMQHA